MPVTFGRPGTAHNVATVEQAAEILMDPHWPKRGPRHTRACAALIEWSENPDQTRVALVRNAFCEAAKEAGVLMETAIH